LKVDTPVGLYVEPGIPRIQRGEFEGATGHFKTDQRGLLCHPNVCLSDLAFLRAGSRHADDLLIEIVSAIRVLSEPKYKILPSGVEAIRVLFPPWTFPQFREHHPSISHPKFKGIEFEPGC
jgi:hypothetical protein